MLGSTGSTVTISAGTLQKAGLIAYTRGNVNILDRNNLEAAAFDCLWITPTADQGMAGPGRNSLGAPAHIGAFSSKPTDCPYRATIRTLVVVIFSEAWRSLRYC
jgi:hypothetical protein